MSIKKSELTPMEVKCVTAVNSLTDRYRQLGCEGKPCPLFPHITGSSTEADITQAVETFINTAVAAKPKLDDAASRLFMFVVYTVAATAYVTALTGKQKEGVA